MKDFLKNLRYFCSVMVVCVALLLSGCHYLQAPESNARVSPPKPAIVQKEPDERIKSTIGRAIDVEEPNESDAGYLLRLKPLSEPARYLISRQDRTIATIQPQYTTNIDIEFVTEVRTDPDSRLVFSVSTFRGVDLDKTYTKHLKNIAKTVEELQLVRSFDDFGVSDELEFVSYNPGGWAGMMTARALGRYGFGFMDTQFPKGKREVGDTWHAPSDLAREDKADLAPSDSSDDFYKSSSLQEAGKAAEFRLVKVERQGERVLGEISYYASGTVKVEYDSAVIGKDILSDLITVKGTIWIDMETGWPIKSTIVRREESSSSEGKIVTEYTTTSKKL